MSTKARELLLKRLEQSQHHLSLLLQSMADHQSWRPHPNHWSFRQLAAHLATMETECFADCIKRIAGGESPYFDPYDNDNRTFPGYDLTTALENWAAIRAELLRFVRALPGENWSFSGRHATFGPVTVMGLLLIILDHDKEHLQDLEQMIADWSLTYADFSHAPYLLNGQSLLRDWSNLMELEER